MPLEIGINAGKYGFFGPKIDGVRATIMIGLLGLLGYLAVTGNQVAIGALIPLAREAIEAYIKARENHHEATPPKNP